MDWLFSQWWMRGFVAICQVVCAFAIFAPPGEMIFNKGAAFVIVLLAALDHAFEAGYLFEEGRE